VSKDFINKQYNKSSIQDAANQEAQLSYFTNSSLQDNKIDSEYLTQWADRKYQSNDYFLNWIKSIFKEENFLTFFKYLRYPLPSARIIKNKIEPQLKRVFNAEDAFFKYDITGKETADFIDGLNIGEFNDEILNRLLYKHNSILIADLDSEIPNTPNRFFIDISDVISIEHKKGVIEKIAFRSSVVIDGQTKQGKIYIDNVDYVFYDNENENNPLTYQHELGYCPADFISATPFSDDWIVKESMFSFIRADLEEYSFLKTLQKMTEPNGALPVISKLAVDYEDESVNKELEPSSNDLMGSQKAAIFNQNPASGGDLQPGTIHEVPADQLRNNDGSINMDIVKNFINFYHIPVDVLKYLNDRVKEIENLIISTIVGDVVESSEESKNKLQIEKSISVLENVLNVVAVKLNRIRRLSDTNMLGLQFGIENVNIVSAHYGTDFFLETQSQLIEEFNKAPNSLERKNIIVRINQNRYKNNTDSQLRSKLLYDLIPYVADKDFDTSKDKIDNTTFQYQTRFTYWISQFEALYGDILIFYNETNGNNAYKLNFINTLIIKIIVTQISPEMAKEDE